MSLNPTFRAKAVAWAAGLEPSELRAIVGGRLLGTHAHPLFDRDEWPEEVVIELLLDNAAGLAPATMDAVVSGCTDAAGRVAQAYVSMSTSVDKADSEAAVRILRVAEATGLLQLARFVGLFSAGAVEGSIADDVLLSAAVRAATRTLREPAHVTLWLALAENPRVCAIAFRQAMGLAPYNPHLSRLIDRYWQAQLVDGWCVDTPLLLRDLATRRNQSDLIRSSLARVPAMLREPVRELLRSRKWSRGWLVHVRSEARPVIMLRQEPSYDKHSIAFPHFGEEARLFAPKKTASYGSNYRLSMH